MFGKNYYRELSLTTLADFYLLIKTNINKGILSNAMHIELNLIYEAAKDKGINSIDDLLTYATSYTTPA